TANALQAANGGEMDAFALKLNASGNELLYSTYLGGSREDEGNGIALDASGNLFIAGKTLSSDFPTANALQSANGGGSDAFVTKLNASGNELLYSTYLGGSRDERANGIAVDASSSVCITGETLSSDFPVVNPLQSASGGGSEAFISKLNPAGSNLNYSTFLGGVNDDRGYSVAVDSHGNAYVTGYSNSTNFLTANHLEERAAINGLMSGSVADAF